jgi:hypothetical protein
VAGTDFEILYTVRNNYNKNVYKEEEEEKKEEEEEEQEEEEEEEAF